ncbi:hypothetical protein SPOG_03620 [Schizosaccharomyces cryophilus OY26]|uniref:Uncharacterized protein n=1 Tax=Schizosaccharomyces cryophilus (strain OY26 / ATCC MYA-4695 / CBS 11777 / NBRC 106824 / NRRL Y48691) TaxID=653667 RepID=S9VZK1_SCHCR|nr:uncharacterized protein SPOG_03620 [Schizosaccharomyces cryophilus OY26]EPY53073.1 hypothetical protein SPOG_03620 [Schizosaccharomyces cryophilus OY26]
MPERDFLSTQWNASYKHYEQDRNASDACNVKAAINALGRHGFYDGGGGGVSQ